MHEYQYSYSYETCSPYVINDHVEDKVRRVKRKVLEPIVPLYPHLLVAGGSYRTVATVGSAHARTYSVSLRSKNQV